MNRKTDWTNWKWKLTVGYWDGQTIIETTGVGSTRKEAQENFFRQYYGAMGYLPPAKPLMPSVMDLINIRWEKREVKP